MTDLCLHIDREIFARNYNKKQHKYICLHKLKYVPEKISITNVTISQLFLIRRIHFRRNA